MGLKKPTWAGFLQEQPHAPLEQTSSRVRGPEALPPPLEAPPPVEGLPPPVELPPPVALPPPVEPPPPVGFSALGQSPSQTGFSQLQMAPAKAAVASHLKLGMHMRGLPGITPARTL